MAQVDSENSTAMPVDTTRRSFLQKAATLAAAGAASGVTAAVALPNPAEASPIGDLDNFIAPAFREIGDEIDEAYDAWRECQDEVNGRDRALRAWEERNPSPGYLDPGDEGYLGPTARSDWMDRKHCVMKQLGLGRIKKHRNDLVETYNNAVRRFSELEANTPSELFYKAGYGLVFDDRESLIAKSVCNDLYNFRTRLLSVLA